MAGVYSQKSWSGGGKVLASAENGLHNFVFDYIADTIFAADSLVSRYLPCRVNQAAEPAGLAVSTSQVGARHATRNTHDPKERRLLDTGDYDRILCSCASSGYYDVYCVIGEEGSGKTTTFRRVGLVLEGKEPGHTRSRRLRADERVVLTLDLRRLDGSSDKLLVESLRRNLCKRIAVIVRKFFASHSQFERFMTSLKRRVGRHGNHLFAEYCSEMDAQGGAARDEMLPQKIAEFFTYIAKPRDLTTRLALASVPLAFIAQQLRGKGGAAVLMVDGLDEYSSVLQARLLSVIMELQKSARLKTLFALRSYSTLRTVSRSAKRFGVITHLGPAPLDVVRERIETYLLLPTQATPALMSLPEPARRAVLARLHYIADLLRSPGAFANTLRSLVGDNSRLALRLATRALSNIVISDAAAAPSQADLACALLIGSVAAEPLGITSRVPNIFTDGHTNALSMVCLRVMDLLMRFQHLPHRRTVSNVVDIAAQITRRDPLAVIDALRYLMKAAGPLVSPEEDVFTETNRLKLTRRVAQSTAPLYLTAVGAEYFVNLMTSIHYVQPAMAGLTWGESLMPAGSLSLEPTLRYGSVRKALRAFLELDSAECQRYREDQNLTATTFQPSLVSCQIIYGVSRSVLGGLEAMGPVNDALDASAGSEVAEWLNLLLLATNSATFITGAGHEPIDALLARYDLSNPESGIKIPPRGARVGRKLLDDKF